MKSQMGNNTSTTISQLLLVLSIGTSTVTPLTYEEVSLPRMPSKLEFRADISEWSKNISIEVPYYVKTSEELKFSLLIDFAEKLIKESVDMDYEFTDVINDYYWELI